MKAPSIVFQVTWGAVLVAVLSSIFLAASAALTASLLLEAQETRSLEEAFRTFAHSVSHEMEEDRLPPEEAAAEAMEESAPAGYQMEVWRGSRLVAMSPQATRLGPASASGTLSREGWLVRADPIAGGLTLVAGFPKTLALLARRIFFRSLLFSMPPSILLAIGVGLFVGRRATAPLVELTKRVSRIAEIRKLEPSTLGSRPSEVRALEDAFRSLLTGLLDTVSRELEFASNASHELRTPLTAIRLNAERALQDAGEQGRSELAAQIAEIDRMVRLIDSLLVMARDAQEGMPTGEVVNVADLARDVARRTLTGGASPHGTLVDEALVRGDENLLSIAIENLLDNARKFTRPPGTLGMRLVEENGTVRLLVTSPGARITEAEKERIFTRFYRDPETRSAFVGHGLGLPLARHIARLHGGEVACVSGPAEDACFSMELPVWKPSRHVSHGENAPGAS